jgi:hypothetical protein
MRKTKVALVLLTLFVSTQAAAISFPSWVTKWFPCPVIMNDGG